MLRKRNHARDHLADKHVDVAPVGLLHTSHMRSPHVPATTHSCIITTMKGEPHTVAHLHVLVTILQMRQ